MSWKGRWMLGVLAIVGGLVPHQVAAADKEDPAVTAARSRQAAVKSVVVEFSETEVMAKGAHSTARGATDKGITPLPPQELTLTSQNRFLIAGDKVRYENNHPHWNNFYAADGSPRTGISISVRDGSSISIFYPHGFGGNAEPWAHTNIGNAALTTPRGNTDAVSLILATVRAFDPAQAVWHLDQFKPTGNTLTIDGATCLEYAGPAPDRGHFIGSPAPQNLIYRYWLDAARSYIIRRAQALEQDKVLEQVDIQYRFHEVGGWFPDRWEYYEYSAAGDVLQSATVTVLSVRFNEEPPADAFILHFPEGSAVSDVQHRKNYHVAADGSLREDDPPPGEAPPGPPPPAAWYQNKYLLVGAAVVLAAAFGGAYWLRRNSGHAAG